MVLVAWTPYLWILACWMQILTSVAIGQWYSFDLIRDFFNGKFFWDKIWRWMCHYIDPIMGQSRSKNFTFFFDSYFWGCFTHIWCCSAFWYSARSVPEKWFRDIVHCKQYSWSNTTAAVKQAALPSTCTFLEFGIFSRSDTPSNVKKLVLI